MAVGKLRKERGSSEGADSFLSILYPHNQLTIMDYNRVVKDLNGMTVTSFLEKLKENFEVFNVLNPRPKAKHHFSLYAGGKWTGLRIKEAHLGLNAPLGTLDSYLLTELCLKPLLGIRDLTVDERIDFVGGIRGLEELERRCKEDSVAAFALHPVSIEEVMAIADAKQIMPPKSTWFEPKPRSGMVVKVFTD